jgi:hypothetical protein
MDTKNFHRELPSLRPIVPSAHSHARGIDELFGGIVDAAAGAAAMGVNIELGGFWFCRITGVLRGQRQFVTDRPGVIRQHRLHIVPTVKFHNATEKISLATEEILGK